MSEELDLYNRVRIDNRMGDRQRKLWVWGPAVVLMVIIFGLSSIPGLHLPSGRLSDKSIHALVYGLLGGLVLRATGGGRWSGVTGPTVLVAALISVVYGAADELHQHFVVGRTTEVLDVMVDGFSATGTVGVIWAWSIIRKTWAEEKV